MGQFRKKPVVIEAFQVTNDTLFEVAAWCDGTVVGAGTPRAGILINTLEGTMRADLGDWVIRGIKGEFYPCKPDVFEATYEPVEDTETSDVGRAAVVPRAALEWLAGGHTGASSKTMCFFFLGVGRPEAPDHPHDACDFGRCLGLLEAVPEWRSRVPELATLSPCWKAIVEQWDLLEELYRKGDAVGCTKALWAILEDVRRRPEGVQP